MYDAGKIIAGLLIFLALLTSPVWYNVVSGKADYQPQPQLPTEQKECVKPAAYMKPFHMDLLNQWRDEVVRQDTRVYGTVAGQTYDKSLTSTCLSCHANKAEFCDRCHNYLGVNPYCWDCHVQPKEKM
ncbi:MAG: sulfate reduction electron transfer complex DsrMKJOP subunit DsrJ [bacterium]